MIHILNKKMPCVSNDAYGIHSNFFSETLEYLVLRSATNVAATAAIINFIHDDLNWYLIAFRINEAAYQEMNSISILHLTNPLLAAEQGLKFYANSTLYTENLLAIGNICIINTSTMTFSTEQQLELDQIAILISRVISDLQLGVQQEA